MSRARTENEPRSGRRSRDRSDHRSQESRTPKMTNHETSTLERGRGTGRRALTLLAALSAAAMVQAAAAQQASGTPAAPGAAGQQSTTGVQPPPTSNRLPHFNVPKVDHPATLVPSSA